MDSKTHSRSVPYTVTVWAVAMSVWILSAYLLWHQQGEGVLAATLGVTCLVLTALLLEGTRRLSRQTLLLEQRLAEKQLSEQRLRTSEARLARMILGSDQGFWDWNLQTNSFIVSPRFETMLDWAPGEMELTPERWPHYVHPDDYVAAMQSIQAVLSGRASIHEVEIRCKTKSGTWRWILTRGSIVERSVDDRPMIMAGTHTDISVRKGLEAELADYRGQLEQQIIERTHELRLAKESAERANSARTT